MADLDTIAARLFEGVMAPLVVGGAILPGHAIGARTALAIGVGRVPADAELASVVSTARIRRARRLVPVDAQPPPDAADWALAAAFHDLLVAVNPLFDAPLRSRAASRIVELASVAIESVPAPASVGEGLSRHTWLARVPEVTRTDAEVSWWAGKRHYRGIDPPARLQAWPRLRRVNVVRVSRLLLELTPLAVDRERLTAAVALLLARTPLTDLASCTRTTPVFEWHNAILALIATGPGRTLALRALAKLPTREVDGVLSRATRSWLATPEGRDGHWRPVVALLGERAIAEAGQHLHGEQPRPSQEMTLAHAMGATSALLELATPGGPWSPHERAGLIEALSPAAQSPAGREARSLFEGRPWTGTADA